MTVRRWLARRLARWAVVRLARYLGRPEDPGPKLLDGEATGGTRLQQADRPRRLPSAPEPERL